MGYPNSFIRLNCFMSFRFCLFTHFFLDRSKARKDSRHRMEGRKAFAKAIKKKLAHFATN